MNAATDIRPLTALRWIAALLVFFSHYSGLPYRQGAGAWNSIFLEGHAGVTIFFVLSGFLITLNYFPAAQDGGFSTYTFYLKRFARVLPLYWFMLALTFMSSAAMNVSIWAPLPLANWTLVQGYFSRAATSAMITGWSLSVEVAFYLLTPLFFRSLVGQTIRAAGVRLLAWSAGLFLLGMGVVAVSQASGLSQNYGFMNDFIFMTFFTLFGRGFHFSVGMFLALVYLRRREGLWKSEGGARVAASLFTLSLLGIFGLQNLMNNLGGADDAWYLNMGIAALAGTLILSLTCAQAAPSRVLSGALPVYLGQVSYALYLFQATPIARALYQPFTQSQILFYALMNLLSALFYEGIERPARAFIVRAGERARRESATRPVIPSP